MLSVIMPVYNVGKYITRAVESVVNQKFRNFEIILSDDGSTDDSAAICDLLAKKDSRIKVIHKQNGGVSSARNAAIDIATGKYIYFMDPDDYVVGEIFEDNITLAEKHSCSQVIFGFYNVICDAKTDKEIRKTTYRHHISGNYTYDEFKHIYKKHRRNVNQVVWNRIYRRDFIGDTRFKLNLNTAEDAIFNIDLTAKGFDNLYYNDECYYVYMCRQNSLMNKYNPKRFDNELLISDAVKELVKSWNMESDFSHYLNCKYAESVLNEYGNMSMHDSHLKFRQIIDIMKEHCKNENVSLAFLSLTAKDFDSIGLKILFTLTKKEMYSIGLLFKMCITPVSMFVHKLKSFMLRK